MPYAITHARGEKPPVDGEPVGWRAISDEQDEQEAYVDAYEYEEIIGDLPDGLRSDPPNEALWDAENRTVYNAPG